MPKCLTLLLIVLGLVSCDVFSGNSSKEREAFSKIKVGMTKEEVIEILGTPDNTIPSSSEKDVYYYFFTESKSGLRSEMPYVLFDSTGRVKFSTYGDGG
ncbi:MAG TPA: outer membrane protein assembly factor BamE [Edaphocola sp.]|nr:outer membrane protein assembly factor BamE [Edaphocola sp.]